MKCIVSLKEQYGKELETFEIEGKHSGDVLQHLENLLCNEIAPYNTYSLKNCKNIDKKASQKTLHFKNAEGKVTSYVIEIKDADYKKQSAQTSSNSKPKVALETI